jgi:endonuclease-8
MPEGPEIRRAADCIESALAGHVIEEVHFASSALKEWERRLSGLRLGAVQTIGKHMLCRFEDGTRVYSHNQLYGRWWVLGRGDYPDTGRSLRLALHSATRSALLYSASEIEVIPEKDLDTHPRLAGLGPDPLDPDVNAGGVANRFTSPRFRGRGFAGLLLDQRFLAGLGNYLRSEILFAARIDPRSRPADWGPAGIRRISRAAVAIPRRSYRTGGTTNPVSRVRRLKSLGWSRDAYRFAVFGRQGQQCHDCGAEIKRSTIAGRRLYYCPRCQEGASV